MEQLILFQQGKGNLVNLKQASRWASKYLNRSVSPSNISYLVQYGRIRSYGDNGGSLIKLEELKKYYDSFTREKQWKKKLGDDLNWHLSFDEYKESERTKHVHRLHPYKGKFIPQLVEYFLDSHTDEYKEQVYFRKGDVVLDPFCGSGTTLVQSSELGIHAVGVEISSFNVMLSNIKIANHNIHQLEKKINELTSKLADFQQDKKNITFEQHLLDELSAFNNKYFPSPEYKWKVRKGRIDEKKYGREKEKEFLKTYHLLVKKYHIKIRQDKQSTFLDKWFLAPVRAEIDFLFAEIKKIKDPAIRKVLAIILSRTVRSCRATTHADLATLKEPVTVTYYCRKHGKICKPIFSIMGWWKRYSKDTLKRFSRFDELRTDSLQICLAGDSRDIDIYREVKKKNPELAKILSSKKIRGIFSSPPYVGLIDYHQQHAYAYDLFGFERRDSLEIGPLFKGSGREARDSYAGGIARVLRNCKKYLQDDYDVFLVANDKYNIYPSIAELANMKIVNEYKRPVLNRVEKNRSAYSEVIFHLKEK